MAGHLFNFRLRPIDQVPPWGQPGELSLDWFGLTDGEYWIQAGEATLFEYNAAVPAGPNPTKYCDYQVARLYEDLLAILPEVLVPVPADLACWLDPARQSAWRTAREAWLELNQGRASDHRFWDQLEAADSWIRQRMLSSAHLAPPARIWLWSDAADVHVGWDNREQLLDGVPAWTALQGSYRLSRADFIGEVRAFHDRLMAAMEQRVAAALAGALAPEIQVDRCGLQRQQRHRAEPLTRSLQAWPEPTDWQAVRAAVESLHHPATARNPIARPPA